MMSDEAKLPVEYVLMDIQQTTLRPRRPRPKVVTLTDRAAERVREIMGRAEKPYAGLRVGVKNGGCAGQEYLIEYAEAAGPLDEVVEDKGVTISASIPKAILFLIGTEIDYGASKLAAKFVFRGRPAVTAAFRPSRRAMVAFGPAPRRPDLGQTPIDFQNHLVGRKADQLAHLVE